MPSQKKIEAKNLGPINSVSIALEDYGVTVLSGPNGSGKSTLLRSLAAAASGSGKLPLRDGERNGHLSAFGAHISIGASTRHTGEFEVLNIEGRFDLSKLVDPKLKDVIAADRQRVKALVSLTGAECSKSLFTENKAFADFDSVVRPDVEKTGDLVEMARYVKADYDMAARLREDKAKSQYGHARGLAESAEGIDLTAMSDAELLTNHCDATRDELTQLTEAKRIQNEQADSLASAKKDLAKIDSEINVQTIEDYQADLDKLRSEGCKISEEIVETKKSLAKYGTAINENLRDIERTESSLRYAQNTLETKDRIGKIIEEASGHIDGVTDEAIDNAKKRLSESRKAVEQGVLIREAKSKLTAASHDKGQANESRDTAARFREAAKCIDEVLSRAIQCERLRIESIDGEARIVVDHPKRGPCVPYHDLSEGEQWKIAIDLGADIVGEGGLLVIPQEGWESIDAFVRPQIDEHAKGRLVYILTAEATRDRADGQAMQAKSYECTGA